MERGTADTITTLEPPTFASVEEERLHRKQRLAAACRIFHLCGFNEGVAGHITVRDPEFPDRFWVNPFGVHFGLMKVSDLICVDESGTVVEGSGLLNQAAFSIHGAIHAARPEVVAAAHSHSLHGKAFSTLGRMLDPLTQDACIFYNAHVLFDEYTGVVLNPEDGKHLAHALGDNKAAILQNHGLLTVGTTVEEATFLFMTMDRSCQAQMLAESVGTPKRISHEVATQVEGEIGSHRTTWFSAQPIFTKVLLEQPDLFD
jgi:ribulose-5-phosphate 4-epimerase/fuculose-1-phosphate aldolase